MAIKAGIVNANNIGHLKTINPKQKHTRHAQQTKPPEHKIRKGPKHNNTNP
jgi:hypothetical protein